MTDSLVANLDSLLFFPEHKVTKQGGTSEYLFFLCRGRGEVFVKDNYKRETFVRKLPQGSIFGEIGVIFDCKITATVKTKNYCMIEALSKEKF
jgi:CRP-like cAMP-binding protein